MIRSTIHLETCIILNDLHATDAMSDYKSILQSPYYSEVYHRIELNNGPRCG